MDGDPYAYYRVEKMTFAKVRQDGKLVPDRTTIRYNARITLTGIPELAHSYMLGPRSAIEWVIDRYQVRTDAASGIVNDPNEWSRETGNPGYIADVMARVVTTSVETMKVVSTLPALDIHAG